MRMKGVHIGALVGMVLGATLFGWSNADAVLCVKSKKGVIAKVTIRDGACKKKESVGDASVLLGLPTTTTSSTTTTTLPGKRAARIVDSAGNDVAWVNPNVGLLGEGVWALSTIDDQAITFPMRSSGPAVIDGLKALGYVEPPIARDDFFYGFEHEGTDCEGDLVAPFFSALLPLSQGYGDLVKIAYPSMDGRSGYVLTSELHVGVWSHEDIQVACATPPDPAPTNVACNGPEFAPIGSEYPCQLDSTTQCTCRRCCATLPDVPLPFWRVQTIDLGLGDSRPPFKVEH
ncbi:MAG: hypothetical protein KIT14_02185 [bacterium]|nr:hypothetical protein [bacterium]